MREIYEPSCKCFIKLWLRRTLVQLYVAQQSEERILQFLLLPKLSIDRGHTQQLIIPVA